MRARRIKGRAWACGGTLSEEVVVEGCGVIVSALRRILAGVRKESPIILAESRSEESWTGLELSGLSRPLNTQQH